ncbi:hypothetical protein GALMADRAFT_206424 [Galerina marginata CBS 339.88]|uniref:Midasin n=1 Tax=Galerina marginata (strain CBS 339.88) TaxID=685588 RepID=A0A067THH8_GALM3|nr:hypothetical protein GALMADRAFT_206424 [Galerina marginata CBS 339.88]
MSFASAIHDPLAINLGRQKAFLLSSIAPNTKHYNAVKTAPTTRQLLSTLSSLLAVPAFTKLVATCFQPILMDLCARWLESEDGVEGHLFALCSLVEVHEELFPILHQLLLKFYEEGPLSFISGTLSPISIDVTRLQRIVLAYYRIMQANRELPLHLSWSLAPLANLVWTPYLDNGVRLLAIRCYSLQSGMGEDERCKLEREIFGEPCGVDCNLNYGQNLDETEREVDGWIMPVVELKRVQQERDEIVTEPLDYFSREELDGKADVSPIEETDLSPFIANVHGVLLLRTISTSYPESIFIPLPSSIEALRHLALQISLRLPTLLTSAPSGGKALLLSHLSQLLHSESQNQIVTIHLADTSLDPRALLGSYVSSMVHPGSFEWKEGVLIRSMREGKWVVFEDIDKASNEVLGVIKPLVESLTAGKWIGGRAQLNVPSQGTVVGHAHFMLFATRSLLPSRDGTFHQPTFFGSHKFSEVIIQSPSTEELQTIVNVKFPRLVGSAAQITISLWDSVRKLGSHNSGRDIGLRELQKFCQRIDNLLPSSYQPMDISSEDGQHPTFADVFPNPSLREDMYLEARDVFFGAGTLTTSSRAHSQVVANIIGEYLCLDPERQSWVLRGKMPELEVEKDANGRTLALRIGRTRLPARSTKPNFSVTSTRPFAMHKPALSLLSRISNAVSHGEPVLLTGETGTGKTSVVSHLAWLLHRPLISLNLSHQTESSDLIGGLKPIDARIPGSNLQERLLVLFGATFSRRKNEKFEAEVRKAVTECKWKRAVGLWKESVRLALERIRSKQAEADVPLQVLDSEAPRKRRKTERPDLKSSEHAWSRFLLDVEEFEVQHVQGKGKFAFGFVEGPLIKALRTGDWVLLDEVNLASPETLECISGLLHSPTASITLTEHGSLEPVPRHPDFRLFACMNPATDIGKKDLPPTIRSRFTEIDVAPPDTDKDTLLSIISQYIGHIAVGDKRIVMDIAEFYTSVKQVAENRQIADGSNHRPHFSMRTLVRALTFAASTASSYSLRRSVWEGCLMAFTMALEGESAEIVVTLARKHLLSGVKNPQSVLSKDPQAPSQGVFVKFGPFYLEKGPHDEDPVEDYIITPSVQQKLIDLSRIILTRRFPVLIEGPTSAGKTSSIEYLAKRTGHRFVRINNHEHTDIQEYLGSYVSDPLTGKLIFKDGLLVQALRYGHWIVLDELNLAPTDVLEALNRLLDDNRELVIPETQEVVRPHPHFMLFATQNPPGLYAGRKVLSRAFRNRFLEVHFEDVPQTELEIILCQKCRIAPSYGKRIVGVFHELQKRRQTSRVFESKQGFATLRDLFRWAGRDAVGYQELAENGYMLLAERTRRPEDKIAVKEVIESVMGVRLEEDVMYDLFRPGIDVDSYLGHPVPKSPSIIWTKAMQRLYILVCRGLKFNEPILLVGETGSGKTSVCQVIADASSQRLLTLNCHQNTETADLIGGLRPVRNRSALQAEIVREASLALKEAGIVDFPSTIDGLGAMLSSEIKNSQCLDQHSRVRLETIYKRLLQLSSIFEWNDGPLIEAMHKGQIFLLDEISLADDSVLERLNSVLEPGRSIVLAERGGMDSEQATIQASQDFKLIATMNPGGDYGKKELSPALRNRFTEVWVPPVDDSSDLQMIINSMWRHDSLRSYTQLVLTFVEWLCLRVGDNSLMSLRDILAWVVFVNSAYKQDQTDGISGDELFHHAAHLAYVDGLSALPQLTAYSRDALDHLRIGALTKLQELVPLVESLGCAVPAHDPVTFFQLGSFAIPKGSGRPLRQSFSFNAPTTLNNAMRVIRACQVSKPILLEGSPGVGKTSLITALANLSGHRLCRINLSDQTDLIDLFGSDLPVEGGAAGEFAWKDAEFLRALQEGNWVLLDEMNLAPQAVLEGLNAVLDHRGTVYIPELNRSFERHPSFRIFAAQNPFHQGSGRKGLPRSFVNRFTKVYIDELTPSDLYTICSHIFPDIDEATLRAMISFNTQLNDKAIIQRSFAQDGYPWEFNLRDIIRWGLLTSTLTSPREPKAFLRNVYLHRFRSLQDQRSARKIFEHAFSATTQALEEAPPWKISPSEVQFGHFKCSRQNSAPLSRPRRILKMQLSALESLGDCVSHSWLAILTGPKSSGKTDIVRTLADFSGNTLREIHVNSATDTMDILGSFEQVDTRRRLLNLIDETIDLLNLDLRSIHGSKFAPSYRNRTSDLRSACEHSSTHNIQTLAGEVTILISQLIQTGSASVTNYQDIHASLKELASSTSSIGQFEWVDGPLIKAMKSGHWVLLDGANLCGPSVLDRLNSLCEPNGSLTLSERGFVNGKVQHIEPHSNFRLFMSVDPHYGELSRAMRNRGIEIALLPVPSSDDLIILRDHYRLPPSFTTLIANVSGQSAVFDALRRGIVDHKVSKLPLLSSTGRFLDQDSALSNLVDHAPGLLFSSPPIGNESSWIHFFSRSLLPGYMAHVQRYIAARFPLTHQIISKFLGSFPQEDVTYALQSFREAYAHQKEQSTAFFKTQPMDFYWNEGMPETYLHPDVNLPRLMVFEILDLSAAIFICKLQVPLIQDQKVAYKEKDRRVHGTVTALHTEIIKVACQVIRGSSIVKPDLMEVKLASKILGFSNHLKVALSASSYDFSALYAISNWLLDSLENCPSSFAPVLEHSKALHDVASLSTGLGLFAIWSKLFLDELPRAQQEVMKHTERMASSLKDSSDVPAFSVMSLESLPSALRSRNAESLTDLRQVLDQFLTANVLEEQPDDFAHIDINSILLELQMLEHCSRDNDNQTIFLSLQKHKFVGWKECGMYPLKDFNMERVSLRALACHGSVLRQHARLAILESRQLTDRIVQLANVLFQSLSLSSNNVAFITSIQKEFLPLMSSMSTQTPSQILGLAWLGLSRLLLNLTIPDTPMDPAVVQNSAYRRLQLDESNLRTQIRLHRQLEDLLTGNVDNDITLHLAPRLADIHMELERLPVVPTRTNVPRLHLFWSEVIQFQKNVLTSPKVDALLCALLQEDQGAYLREQVIQESLAGFYQRLDAVYPDFSDISILLKLAIHYMRLGLRLITESRPLSSNNTRAEWAASLISFPPASSSAKIIDSFPNFEPSNKEACRHILLALAAFSLETTLGLQSDDRFIWLQTAYEQLARLWLVDRAKEKKLDEENSTLYRRSKLDHTAITDAEIEEEQFLSMFPSFEDALETEANQHSELPRASVFVQPADMETLLLIHYNLMESHNGQTKNHPIVVFQEMRGLAIQALLLGSPESLPETLDHIAFPFQFVLLHNKIQDMDANHTLMRASYNFYLDANYTELTKCASAIISLRQRLHSISEEWPDQMVVKHLIERCEDILNISSKSPVAKLLSMVEQLLVHSEDWEAYSNRTNSIKVHQDELVRLVVDWRRLELSCWQCLLDSQAETFTKDLSGWWFHLYDAAVRGALSVLSQEPENGEKSFDSYIETLIPLLDTFITSSPLGQFHARMRLLRSFDSYIGFIARSKTALERQLLERVRRVLRATFGYYVLFSDLLHNRLMREKASLESEVKAFIKLASWKDVNVQALKQSAQKTHRQLYKIMKKFRDVLRQPVAGQLQVCPFSDTDHQSSSMDRPCQSPQAEQKSLPPRLALQTSQNHLLNLNATFGKYDSVVANHLRPFIQTHSAQSVDDVASEIITTSKNLASLTVPSGLSGDLRRKHQKALLVRKKRAWADMLKELKHAGFASNVKPEILLQNASQRWIREQPIMPGTSSMDIEVDKGELYFTKLSGSLPSLRASLPTHHSDLTTRELSRGHMFLESGFSMAVDLRSRLTATLDVYQQMQATVQRLHNLASCDECILPSSNLLASISSITKQLCRMSHALSELQDNANTLNQLEGVIIGDIFSEISSLIDTTNALSLSVGSLLNTLNVAPLSLLTRDENHLVTRAEHHLSQTMQTISKWCEKESRLNYLLSPLLQWLGQQPIVPISSSGSSSKLDGTKVENLLNSLLVSVQSMAARIPNEVDQDKEKAPEKYVLSGYQLSRDCTHILNLGGINDQLNRVLADISSQVDLRHMLNNILPFLEIYLALACDQLATHNNWTKSLFKLNYVLCSVLQTLSLQGFCQPQEGEDANGADGELADATGGVGIGEGSGTDNVSKEIEDESQIEGLKGEDQESKDPDGKHEDGDAIEMGDDFGGALEEVPEPDSDDDAVSEDGSEPEFDETLGNLDDLDPSAVDEKMWGDENGPEDSVDSGKADKDHAKEQEGSSEVVAKESKEQKKPKENSDDREMENEDTNAGEDVEEEAKAEENEESNDPNVSGAPIDEYVQEANTLDLPDEMDLDRDAVENEADRDVDDDDEGMKDEGDENPADDEAQNDVQDFPMDDPKVDSVPPVVEAADGPPADQSEGNPTETTQETEEEENPTLAEEVVARPDISTDGGMTDPNDVANPEAGEDTSAGEAGTSHGGTGQALSTEEIATNDEGSLEITQAAENVPAEGNGTGSAATGAQQGRNSSQSEIQPLSNPLRSLGDALQEIRQRFDEILNSDPNDAPREQVGESNKQSQLEYLLPKDVDHNNQALGPAGEEQVAKLNQLSIIEEEMQDEDAPMTMDVDTPFITEQHETQARDAVSQQQEGTGQGQRDDIEGAILQTTVQDLEKSVLHPDLSGAKNDVEMEDQGQDVELQLREWRAADYPEDGAERVWRLYESLTHDLAYTLCEQLRLILEPTLATRLKGDYRTGKRLNMKKVIAYIASDYTKDKIWLRRTKPSQREYQVLISIDDSRSMAESHSVHLAYQTLALISKALSRLESGDVGIAKFGETVDLLHGFDEGPFSDHAGIKVINAFRFTQKATNVLSLLETSLKVLENARERKAMSSASGADLWQLQIIISDGMCQDHNKLRTILRKAEEQRVMIVFIILDSLQSGATEPGSSASANNGSILTMEKAEFKTINGKMELQLKKYLDSFPFEYYVVLRHVEALPEVLAGTLKQFFERISEE